MFFDTRVLKQIYATAQRQLDTRMHGAGWNCRVKITSWVQYLNGCPLHACLHQAISIVCNHEHYIILSELLNEYYNINSIYMMNLRILSLYFLIDSWIHCPSYLKAARMKHISCPTVWPDVENGFGVENGFFIGDWIYINLFEFIQSVGWKVRKYQY